MCVAVPGRVISISSGTAGSRPAVVSFPGGMERRIDLAMVPEARVDDYVVTHSGFAISVITEEEADTTMRLLADGHNGQA